MINVVVIDDSAFMRKAIQIMVESDPEIKVVATARDGEEGFEKVKQYRPDIVTLDIEMPRTNGLTCLDMIMKEVPTPVLVVSSISAAGAKVTLDALDRGAVDYIQKTQSFVAIDITQIKDSLISKIKTIAKHSNLSRLRARWKKKDSVPKAVSHKSAEEKTYRLKSNEIRCIVIGVSTGGPPVVQSILSALPENYPAPILIAQHMPKEFTNSFAERLNKLSAIRVKEASSGDIITKGTAYIAQGGKHLVVRRNGVNVIGDLTIHPADSLYHPSADVLFSSAIDAYGASVLGVILTGMGCDGVEGLKKLKKIGGKILAQDEASCVVYGMPKAAVDAGIVDSVLSVNGIMESLRSLSMS